MNIYTCKNCGLVKHALTNVYAPYLNNGCEHNWQSNLIINKEREEMIIDANEQTEKHDSMTRTCSFKMSKKEFYTNGVKPVIEQSMSYLFNESLDEFIAMMIDNLNDEDNQYEFELIIRKKS